MLFAFEPDVNLVKDPNFVRSMKILAIIKVDLNFFNINFSPHLSLWPTVCSWDSCVRIVIMHYDLVRHHMRMQIKINNYNYNHHHHCRHNNNNNNNNNINPQQQMYPQRNLLDCFSRWLNQPSRASLSLLFLTSRE